MSAQHPRRGEYRSPSASYATRRVALPTSPDCHIICERIADFRSGQPRFRPRYFYVLTSPHPVRPPIPARDLLTHCHSRLHGQEQGARAGVRTRSPVQADPRRAQPHGPSGCIFSPAPPVCCPASSSDARPARCSWPIAAPHLPAHPPPSTSAPSPGADGCPTNAPSTCSSGTPGGSAPPD